MAGSRGRNSAYYVHRIGLALRIALECLVEDGDLAVDVELRVTLARLHCRLVRTKVTRWTIVERWVYRLKK